MENFEWKIKEKKNWKKVFSVQLENDNDLSKLYKRFCNIAIILAAKNPNHESQFAAVSGRLPGKTAAFRGP